MTTDPLFAALEQAQVGNWGTVLDAGTGRSSLNWLSQLDCRAWTAVTAERRRAEWLDRYYGRRFRSQDRLLVGNWSDPGFLRGETFSEVLADYLIGACDRHSPYGQIPLLRRLVALTEKRLYLIGLEPYPAPQTPAQEVIVAIAHLRDACHALAGHRYHREYPFVWTLQRLRDLGLQIVTTQQFPTRYGRDFVAEELAAGEQSLAFLEDGALQKTMRKQIAALKKKAHRLLEKESQLECGFDYLIVADKGTIC